MGDIGPLFVDLYELTMAQAYFSEHYDKEAVFSTFVRKLPKNRNFLIACGLEDVLSFLENFKFNDRDIDFLYSLKIFKDDFLDYLKGIKFTGDVFALKEGTVFFENEPIIEVKAKIIEAQLLETYVLNQIQLQTLLATKGARVCVAAKDRDVVDFGSRRAHGTDAAIKAARAFYIAGMKATSNVLAGKIYNIPVTGTMAHSYIQVHESEIVAFEHFSSLYPETTLLVDTYSVEKGIKNVIELAKKLGDNFKVKAIRIDSGDIIETSKVARKILDREGLYQVKIFVSGGLDEYEIENIVKKNAPIDGFGVGTKVIVSEDVPCLDIVYKLTEYSGEGKFKKSKGKKTVPFKKQVFRFVENGKYKEDLIGLYKEVLPGMPLISKVMEKGKRTEDGKESLQIIRDRCQEEIKRLPKELLSNTKIRNPYPVNYSYSLQKVMLDIEEGRY